MNITVTVSSSILLGYSFDDKVVTDQSGYFKLIYKGDPNNHYLWVHNLGPIVFPGTNNNGYKVDFNEGTSVTNVYGTCPVDQLISINKNSGDIIDTAFCKVYTPADTLENKASFTYSNSLGFVFLLYATNPNYIIINYSKNGVPCILLDTIVPECKYYNPEHIINL